MSTAVTHPVIDRRKTSIVARIVAVVVVLHVAITLLYLNAQSFMPGPVRSAVNGYMEPVFKQSWWVFAPDPVSSNVYLSVRATTPDGSQTDWFGVSRCDIDEAILHRPVPNRRYLASFQLVRQFRIQKQNLPDAAAATLTRDRTGAGTAWAAEQATVLASAGATPSQIALFMKNDKALVNLASGVAQARWGQVRAVQVQIKEVHTRPYSQRDDTYVPLKTQTWQSGFTTASAMTPAQLAPIATVYGPQGGCR